MSRGKPNNIQRVPGADGWRKCEVCGTPFHPTPNWAWKSAITGNSVCRFNCVLKTEREKDARLEALKGARNVKSK